MRATDYILDIDCVPDDEEMIQAQLFLTTSTGNVSREGGLTAYFDSAADRDAAAKLFDGARKIDRPRIDWRANRSAGRSSGLVTHRTDRAR